MNYSVHSIMYFYFGLTQTGPTGKRLAKKFSMFITTIQLLQVCLPPCPRAPKHVCTF